MRFMTLYRPSKLRPPTQEDMAAMGRFIEEMKAAGILLATDGIQPGGKHLHIRLSAGKLTVTDGPFAESKELIGGYALLQVKSVEELVAVSKRFLEVAGDGESEALQMFEFSPPAMS